MRADALNLHVYSVRTEITPTKQIPTSHICSRNESKLKEFLVDKTLSQICSTDKDESKVIIVDKFSTEEGESECVCKNIIKQKDANNQVEYEESSVTYEVLRSFNIFECDRNILNRIDGTYERV